MPQHTSLRSSTHRALVALLGTAFIAACADGTSPKSQNVSISVKTVGAAPSASSAATGAAATSASATAIVGGGHSLNMTAMELTIGDLRLQREGSESEDDHGGVGHDDFAFTAASQTIALPVDGGMVTIGTKALPAGTFTEVEAELRSLHLVGSYDQAPFDVAVELSHDLTLTLNPPLTTTGSGDQNVTVSIDFSACFANGGVPVDPRTLASGGSAARNSFRDCVASHLRAFDDRNRDGQEPGDDHGNNGHGSDG
jgi:hypothetical protein